MVVDWNIAQFKTKIIDNARYIFDNYIDTSKGLDALYNRPEVSTDKAKCYKNFNLIRLTSDTKGEHITAWEIDDAANVNKLYVKAKVNAAAEWEGSLAITDSTLTNCLFFTIFPKASNADFNILTRINGSQSSIYRESVELSYNQYYQIEAMIDFQNNSISSIRDNTDKNVLITGKVPSFDVIHVGLRAYNPNNIPNTFGKDIFITWE